MATYGLDIGQVMGWTFPQLRLLARHERNRVREDRRWQLMLASGTLAPEMWDELWHTLGGKKLGLKSSDSPAYMEHQPARGSHGVDEAGNVVAPGAPLLSDIALGKAHAPPLIPIRVIDKHKKENDGSERLDATAAGDSPV